MSAAATAEAKLARPATASTRSTSPSLVSKRKRPSHASRPADWAAESRVDDMYEVVPSLFEALRSAYPKAAAILEHQTPSSQRSAKRSKRSPSSSEPARGSITDRVHSRAYASFEELVKDVERAVEEFVSDKYDQVNSDPSTSSVLQEALSLQKDIRSIMSADDQDATEPEASAKDTRSAPLKTVLTLFGTSGQGPPRQYFTGLKDASLGTAADGIDPSATAQLPNGIFTTSILPSKTSSSSASRPARKLKDIVPPPPSSLPYKPPNPPASRATRSQVVEWYKPSTEPPRTRPGDREIYAEQSLNAGVWLDYLSHTDTDESLSEKRLKRDRALSGSEAPDESELEFLQQQKNSRARAKKSSLFRSAFSSFGPSRDDSEAVVPAQMRSHIWWEKAGKDMYAAYADNSTDPDAVDGAPETTDAQQEDQSTLERQVQEFQEAVDAYLLESDARPSDEQRKDEDEILDDVTDAIEALLLYQQERHKTVSTNGRLTSSQQPSVAEQALYETMELQLKLIVSQLPPYAVSRLNGEKLGRLNISTVLPIPQPSVQGILEDPERPAPVPSGTSQGRSVGTSQGSTSRSTYQQNANTPPARPNPQPPRSAAATTAGYYGRPQSSSQFASQAHSAQQPARSYQQQAQVPNGYSQHLQNGYQRYGQASGVQSGTGSPVSRQPHANQYTNRPQQVYQPRHGAYQGNTGQVTSSTGGRSSSPQNSSSFGPAQNRASYNVGQAGGGTPNGQAQGGHARPSTGSSSNSANAAAAAAAATAAGAFSVASIKFSEEELAAINQRRQLQNSPPTPQTPTAQRPPSANGVAPQAPMQA